jgi:hypothetical protein
LAPGTASFRLKRCGASRVLAIDFLSWAGAVWGEKRSFNTPQALVLIIEDRLIDTLQMSADVIESFEFVFSIFSTI